MKHPDCTECYGENRVCDCGEWLRGQLAAAAREERERVVAWLIDQAERAQRPDEFGIRAMLHLCAGYIKQGKHAPGAGKGGV